MEEQEIIGVSLIHQMGLSMLLPFSTSGCALYYQAALFVLLAAILIIYRPYVLAVWLTSNVNVEREIDVLRCGSVIASLHRRKNAQDCLWMQGNFERYYIFYET